MSVWTHVLGTIRFDHWPGTNAPEPYLDSNIPHGSEGGLEILKWTNPDKDTVAKYTFTIFGDLRDYDNEQEIIDYFNRITKDRDIRQACFTIKVEGKAIRTFVWKDDGLGGFVEVWPV